MKNVLLIGSYNKDVLRTGQYLSPPFGIHRIASYLENKGLANVDVVDPTLDYNGTLNTIREKNYDIIGHSILHPTLEDNLRLAWESYKASPNSIQIAGGQGAAFNYHDIISKTPIKTVVRGFGEHVLEQILEGKPTEEIRGLYIQKNGEIKYTGLMERMSQEEFRDISLNIDFDKIPYTKYWEFMEKKFNQEHLNVIKNTGIKTIRLTLSNYCPMGCTHCSSTNFLENQKLLFLSPTDIVHMMKNATKAHPTTENFYFCDDNFFLLRKKGILELCDLTKTLDKKYNMMLLGRVDNVDEETLNKMSEAGFTNHFYGIETFSNRLAIEEIKKVKSSTVDYSGLAKKMISATLDAGITPQISLMLFLPSTTIDDLETTIENTVDFMEKGAKVTVFPYVEAYSGATMMNNHEVSYKNFEIEGEHFKLPDVILADDMNIRKLAKESIEMRNELNASDRWDKYSGNIPQPVDTLNMFYSIYKLSGKSTKRIEDALRKYD